MESSGTPETSGSTGLGASETGEPSDGGSSSGSSTSGEGSTTGEGSGESTTTTTGSTGTTGGLDCFPSPIDASCSCLHYDGVCACADGTNHPANLCDAPCACDVPVDELPCGLVVMGDHPVCMCFDTEADPAACGCAMVGDVCACGANNYPPATCGA
jgi:hypothetical protein